MNRSPQSPGTSTFFDHVQNETGGRFAEAQRRETLARPQIIGAEPSANYPRLPFNPFENDQAPEPTIDMSAECGATFNMALGEPAEVAEAQRILEEREATLGEAVAPAADFPRGCRDPLPNPIARSEACRILPKIAKRRPYHDRR